MQDKIDRLIESLTDFEQRFGKEILEIKTYLNDLRSPVQNNFEELKNLVQSDIWPVAADPAQICDLTNEQEKLDRAEGILELSSLPLNGVKFLDFGCGEGYTIQKAKAGGASLAVGYDIVKSDSLVWEEEKDGQILTTNFDLLKSYGPFDSILLYDVLDHAEDHMDVLEKIKSLSHNNTKYFFRLHPWCGRFASHLYPKLNKGYIHLVFTQAELKELGLDLEYNKKVLFPVATYNSWFKESFSFLKNTSEKEAVDPFYSTNQLVRGRILNNWIGTNIEGNWPDFQLSMVYLDYFN
jgi:hypothetical protein